MTYNKNIKLLLIVKHQQNEVIETVYVKTRDTIRIDFSIQLVCLKQYISQWGSQPTLPSHFFHIHTMFILFLSMLIGGYLYCFPSLIMYYDISSIVYHRIGLFLLSSVIYYCNCHYFLIDITSIYYLIVVQYSIAVVSCHRMLYHRNYSQADFINICDLRRQCTQAGLITPTRCNRGTNRFI